MKLLIVDDSDLLQARLSTALLEWDNKLSLMQAFSYKEAREKFSPFSPDTVVLDISLPDGSGINLLKLFKKEQPEVNVIMFTNYPTTEFKKSCLDLGADYFLEKSCFNKLLKILNESKKA
jgi:DNA-binding response OmpR family regulator